MADLVKLFKLLLVWRKKGKYFKSQSVQIRSYHESLSQWK